MKLKQLFVLFVTATVLTIVVQSAPTPQEDDVLSTANEDENEILDSVDKSDSVVETTEVKEKVTTAKPDKKKDKKDKEDDDEGVDLGKVLGDALNGFFGIVTGVGKVVGNIVSNKDVQKTVGGVIDAGVKGTARIVEVGTDLAEKAPEIINSKRRMVDGLSRTLQDTQGIVEGTIDEVEQTAKLVGVFARAYVDVTLKRIDEFMTIFNNRLQCNSKCRNMDEGSEEKEKCLELFECESFVKPKTRAEKEAEEKAAEESILSQYDYGDYE